MAIDPITGLPSSNNPVASTSTASPSSSGYVPSSISTASMAPVTPVPVPPATPVPTSTYTAPINATADSLTALQQEAKDKQAAVDQANAKSSEYAGLIATAQGQNVKDVAGTYASQGVNTAYNQLQDLAAQATGLKNEAAAIPINNAIAYRGNAGVSSGVDTVSRDQLAQNALKALSLGQQYAIAEGNYNKAKNIADQMIENKYAGEEARIKSLQTQQAAYDKYTLTPMEQKRLDAVKKATDLEATQLAEKKANDKAISDLVVNASSQNAPQALRDKASKAKTPMEAANILGVYAGDYRKSLLLEEQIKTEKAQRANINSQIKERDNKVTTATFVTGKDGIVATLPKAAQDRYYKMQGDFDTATKTYRGAIDAAGSVKALSKDATAQDQTAIIFQYMKTLDPNSTVREGEFALVAATAGLGDRAVNAIKRLDNGQRLNEAQIKDIVGATDKLASNAKSNLQATSKEYDRRASIQGLPKGLFLETQTSETGSNDSPEAQAIKAKLEAANPTLKHQPFEGTSAIKNITNGRIDFAVPTTTTK